MPSKDLIAALILGYSRVDRIHHPASTRFPPACKQQDCNYFLEHRYNGDRDKASCRSHLFTNSSMQSQGSAEPCEDASTQLRAYVSSIRTPSMVNREPLDRWPTYRGNRITQSHGIPWRNFWLGQTTFGMVSCHVRTREDSNSNTASAAKA